MVFKKLILSVAALVLLTGASTQFEQRDILGTTTNFSGSVGTSFVAVPSSPGKPIAEALVRCSNQTPQSSVLQVSFTSSTGPWISLSPGEFIGWTVKGYMTQIWILGNNASVDYEVVLNREP